MAFYIRSNCDWYMVTGDGTHDKWFISTEAELLFY